MKKYQPGVLAPVPPQARYLTFALRAAARPRHALKKLVALIDGESSVVGIGQPLLRALDCRIPGMRGFPAYTTGRVTVPSTPAALWCWLRGTDRGELFHRGRAIGQALAPAIRPTRFRISSS